MTARATRTERQAMRRDAQARMMRRAVSTAVAQANAAAQHMVAQAIGASGRAVQLATVLAHAFEVPGVHWLDVRCEPSGTEATVRWASPLQGLSQAPDVGVEVVVLFPGGSLSEGGIALCVVPNNVAGAAPSLSADRMHIQTPAAFEVDAGAGVRIETDGAARLESGSAMNLRGGGAVELSSAAGGLTVQSTGAPINLTAPVINLNAPSIALGSGGGSVARSGDTVSVPISASVQSWIGLVSAALVLAPPSLAPFAGAVTSGNPNVTA